MKLRLLICVLALAAMGQKREVPPPREVPRTDAGAPMSPEEVAGPPAAQEEQPEVQIIAASASDPGDFLWKARPVVVFADSPEDPAFTAQMEALQRSPRMLIERDVVIVVDSDPDANSVWRQRLHPKGFSLVIIDKDGQVKLRKPLPWDVREISRAINKFPLRLQEIERARLQ